MATKRTEPERRVTGRQQKRLRTRAQAIATTVVLPQQVHRRALLAALQRNWTLNWLLNEAVGEWLRRHEHESPGRRRA